MKKYAALALGLAVVAAFAAGCGKSSPSQPQSSGVTPSAADVAQVNAAIAANGVLVNEDVYESNDPTQLDPAGPGMAAIRPMFWWRKITSVTRTFDTEYTTPDSLGRPTRAVVSVHKRMLGSFNILVGDSTASPDSILRKPLDDRWERRLLMRRVAIDSLGNPIWRLVGTSGVTVTSAGAATHIVSVRVQAGTVDTTITDPLQMHRLRRVLRLPAGVTITVTVTTGSPNDVVVLYRRFMRGRFHNNGDNTYTATWTTPDEGGFRHFGVNALSHGTLLDDAAPYDSQAWLFPFAVHQDECDLDRGDGGRH
jgi:hypothetical protein